MILTYVEMFSCLELQWLVFMIILGVAESFQLLLVAEGVAEIISRRLLNIGT